MIKGKIIHVGQVMSGVSKAGKPWKKQEFALETDGQYPKKVAFSILNDKVDQSNIQMGQIVEIEVDASSREYQGKWFTELNAWRINNLGMAQPVQQQPVYQQTAPAGYQQPQYPSNPAPQNNGSNLPF